MKNCLPVKAQQIIQDIVIGEDTHEINNGSSNADVEHQIGNAFVTVFIAESLEGSSQVFQTAQLLIKVTAILPANP